jgi:hypothetical protein
VKNSTISEVGPPELDLRRLESDVVELSLLLPGWQLSALEKASRRQGVTAGQMVRRLVQQYLLEDC